ncbi:AAA ATPase midasin, partial [Physocladia obscura]
MQETEFVLDAADRLSTGQSTGTTPVVSQLLDSRTAFSTTVFAAPIPELAVATLRDACGLCSCLPNMLLLSSNKLLQQLSLQLLRPCTTREIAARPIVRRLLLDLVSRWLLPDFPVVEAICAHHSRGYLHAYDLYSTSTSSSTCSKKTYRDGFASPNSVIESGQSNSLTTLLFLHAFAELLPLAPHIQVIAFACFQKAALSPVSILCEALTVIFQEELASEKQQQKQEEPNFTAFLAIASSLYNLTRGSYISTITDLWDFAPIFELINLHARDLCHFTYDGAADAAVLLAYLVHIMANVLGMTDVERGGALEKFLGELYYTDERITLLRLFHEEEEEIARALMFNDDAAPFGNILTVITAADLSPFVVDIAGVLLPKPDISSVALLHDVGRTRQLVWTETTRRNLNRIAISVSIGAPVLVTGSSGVGKTSLVEEIARMVGQKDSKILLGTYVCQSEPGSFKWQPGILTTAVTNGRWVLIEDLDLAPLEVVSVLIPLLETGHLFIPARGEKVRAKQGFQLFATQTLSSGSGKFGLSSRMAGSNGEVGAALWNRITVDAIPGSEMIQVIETMYPNLGSQYNLGMHIVKTFEKLVETFHVTVSISRSVSFRDVIKWCNRLEKLHSEVLSSCRLNESDCKIESISLLARESLFREALECFTMMIQNTKVRERAAQCVAQILAIPNMRLEFFTEHYQPTLVTDAGEDEIGKNSVKIGAHSKVVVGRVTLSFAKNPTKAFETANKFAYTSLSLRLLEKLAVCISMQEAVLLTGETGTGKTTIVQQLANMCGKSLTVINMSQQSDSTDLLGGFKPVEATMIAMPMLERFEVLFGRTFSSTANSAFLESIRSAYIKKKWDILKLGFGNAVRMADKVLGLQKSMDGEPQVKKSKKRQADPALIADWIEFSTLVKAFSAQLDHLKNSFLFSFVEGTLVKAIVRGDWILLDEVNLASTETLESLSGILQSATGSLLLLERGDTEPIKRHSDFRLFACMNPANDAGKRDLPPGLLSRFSEIWVDSPDTIPQDLVLIIRKHLNSCLPPPTQGGNAIVANIAEFHTSIKAASESGYLVDGAGQKVYINLRTLTRALGFAASCAETYGLPRGIYEGCQMTYATILGKDSLVVAQKLFEKHIMNGIKNQGSFIRNVPKMDEDDDSQILFGTYWIKKGLLVPDVATKYVLTPSVDANLSRVARAVMARKYPVLIQGPTSAGKTSMVEYLAMRTGHRFIRVNNHEHTDLQEYIGTYVSNAEGKLVFRE